MIKAAIIEDEINQRELLHHQIRMQLPEITEILEAGNGEEGLALIYAQQPDLIFLDISMPIMDGFTMLKTIDQSSVKPFEVIVVTVSDNRAVEAYRLSSLDYLVKPVSDALLKEAFEKFKDRWELKLKIQDLQEQVAAVEHNINNQSEPLMAIYHHFDGYLYFKPKKEVVYLEADSQYTFVHMANRKTFHQANTLKVYETMLVDHDFYRISRSHLINLNFVKGHRYKTEKNAIGKETTGLYVVMTNGLELLISRRRRDGFLGQFVKRAL